MLCKFRWNRSINKNSCPQKGSVPLKGAATSNAVKNYKKILHINILEPITNHGKVKKKNIISIILGMVREEVMLFSLS